MTTTEAPETRTIRCASGAARCHGRHATPDEVFRCYVAAGKIDGAWPCGWQYEGAIPTGDPEEPYYRGILECDAPARERANGTGYDCADGHEFTTAEARAAAGWDYAEDAMEAAYLAKHGTEPRTLVHAAPWTEPLPSV
jgi:hypothetical protein